ncbi:MAG: hypothetical protein ACJAYA_001432 [Bacteroidia bacterium]|jgi:hypothetical protein
MASVEIAGVDTIIAVFEVDYTTIEEPLENVVFKAYPVPTSDNLNISLSFPEAQQFDIAMYTVQGKEVYRQVYNQQALQTTIDTRDLARGLYVLSLEGEEGSKQIKVPLVD